MTIFEAPTRWRAERLAQTRAGLTLGFVPTMGALHEGHLSLVRRSRAENDRTVVSIFVNPTQFDDHTDLAQYPRTLEADLGTLRGEGANFVFLPWEPDLYPDGALVFPNAKGGFLDPNNFRNRVFSRVVRKALGVNHRRITPHTLRHTFASKLAQKGMSLYEIGMLLGHTSSATTEIYAHLCSNTASIKAVQLLNSD